MSGLPNLAQLSKSREEKNMEDYKKRMIEVSAKVMDLLFTEGMDTFGKVLDVVNTVQQSLNRMMIQGKFEKPQVQ